MRPARVKHCFIEFVPEDLEPETAYVSMEYGTVVHSCLCGCGSRVVTPLAPTEWRLTYDGETITLFPSIGNWSFACQSHYVIRRNEVIWLPRFSRERIAAIRQRDRREKEAYHADPYGAGTTTTDRLPPSRARWWRRLGRRRGQ
jgi:hypothetical protein